MNITWLDAKRLLPKEKYEALEIYAIALQIGYIPPGAWGDYYYLLDELREKKDEEHAKAMFSEYEEKLKNDEHKLKALFQSIPVSTNRQAIDFFSRDFPKYKNLLELSNPISWIPNHLPKIQSAAEKDIKETFIYFLMGQVDNPEAFNYNKKAWPFVIPNVNYVKIKLDSLEFSLTPYSVASIKIHRAEHTKTIKGWSKKYHSSDESICQYTEIQDPVALNTALPKIIIPLKLILGLASGDLQPEGCEVLKHKDGIIMYKVEGFSSEVVLPHDFLLFIMELGPKPFKRLQELGLLNEITLKILESKKREENSIEPPMVREKDREYLRIINGVDDFLTYSGWGKALELTRDGAYRALIRLEENGLLTLEKHGSGEGIKASLTDFGLSAIVE